MKLADGIRKHGFRKWYERELLQSHAHLTLTFLCMLGVFMGFEGTLSFHSLSDRVTDLSAIVICGGTGLWALRRYLYLLNHAEAVANQADCPACGTYGRLRLVHEARDGENVGVRCGKCGHEWRIDA